MHDAKGRKIHAGDVVLVPCRVIDTCETEEFCNVRLETLGGRFPDGAVEKLSWLNTRQLIRANDGDDTSFKVVRRDGKPLIE